MAMNIQERADQAAKLKATGVCNCTQSVLKVFEDKIPMEEQDIMKLTAGFAAGMGCLESTCGALIGAVMVSGMLTDGQDSRVESLYVNVRIVSAMLLWH